MGRHQVVLYFLQDGQHGLLVVEQRHFQGGAGIVLGGLALSAIEQRQGQGRPQRPQSGRGIEQACQLGTFVTGAGRKTEAGKESGLRHPQLRLSAHHPHFCGTNIGAALQQRGGQHRGQGGQRRQSLRRGHLQSRWRLPQQNRQAVGQLLTRCFDIDTLRHRALPLRLGLRHICR